MVLTAWILAAGAAGAAVWALVRRRPHADPGDASVRPATIAVQLRRFPRLRRMIQRAPRSDVVPAGATTTTQVATTTVGLSVAAAGVFVGALAFGLLVFLVRGGIGVGPIDRGVAEWAEHHATSLSTAVLRRVTMLGGTLGATVVALLVGAIEYRRRPNRAIWVFLAVVLVGQNVLANGVKLLVDRARPAIDPLAGFSGSSFPSGHSATAAAVFAALALLAGRGRSDGTRAIIAGLAAAAAVAVAGTRVLLGVHWLTDAAAGLVLGWSWFALCSIAFGGRLLRFGAPVAVAERIASDTPVRSVE